MLPSRPPEPLVNEILPLGRNFVAKKAFFSFLGGTFRIFGPDGQLQFYVKQKAFRLKEELNVFADEAQTQKRLTILARNWSDFSSAYDVTDATTGAVVGACKREGLKSMFRDSWLVLGEGDALVGTCKEDSMFMALIRRFFFKNLIPQSFTIANDQGAQIGTIKQRWNPFQLAYDVSFDGSQNASLDPRLGIALVVLLLAIEGRQD
ncbi:hypothetical protein LBMAG42_33620 [Deltaproteobacteria bacterium]|nr:hypothetical protein LBMAG42_33620 [Deltaproteobacteria bacterium]